MSHNRPGVPARSSVSAISIQWVSIVAVSNRRYASLGLPVVISRDERDADAMLVLKSLYRTQPERVETAQRAGVPVYVLRGSSIERLREALAEMFRSDLEQTSLPARRHCYRTSKPSAGAGYR